MQALSLGVRARASARQPHELMPPMESDLLESDFDSAVNAYLYLFESRRDEQRMVKHAELVGLTIRVGPVKADDYDDGEW